MGNALLTDLYELTMAASYFAESMNYPATFDLSFRDLPKRRNFLISCGVEQALDFLEQLRFDDEDLAYLSGLEMFSADFIEFLGGVSFEGEVWAIPEGEAVFPLEPVLRVHAPLIQTQIVETYLLNCINFSTAIASKAARVAIACEGKPFVDFSARRAHGPDASLFAARAAYLAGALATSNVLAGERFGIPVSGTMAHSYVMAFSTEMEAFRAFARSFPESAVFLIDTFDTVAGARKAAEVAGELRSQGIGVRAVRIDSGDLALLARKVRAVLDEAGHPGIQIFASGDLDEERVSALIRAGAPIDGFGVGTRLGTSADAPFLGAIYKLVEDLGGPKLKLSTGKVTIPGVKQVYRQEDGGKLRWDVLALASEPPPEGGRPMLEEVMSGGRRTRPRESLETARERCRATLDALGEDLRSLDPSKPYEVRLSAGLEALNRAGVSERSA